MNLIKHRSKKYISLFCLILTIIVSTSFIAVVLAKNNSLSIKVITSEDLDIRESLLNLAKEIEKSVALYKTTNQKAYWSSQGKKLFYKFLRSKGYYDGTIIVEIPNDQTNAIIFHINSWQRYNIGDIRVIYKKGSNKDISTLTLDDLPIKKGQFAIAQNISDSQEQLLKYIENNNCLLSAEVSHEATINHINNKVDVVFLIKAGQRATIGDINFTGLNTVNSEYARKLINLEKGQCFRAAYIQKSQGLLQKSGLFASTAPSIPTNTNKDGSADVTFNLTERKSRSVKTGVSYGTNVGLGATLSWEHRNFFGSGEKVSAKIFGNTKEQLLDLSYAKPYFKNDDQTLKLGIVVENKKSKAFDSQKATISALIEKDISNRWVGGVGTKFSQAKIRKQGDKEYQAVSLLSMPLFIVNDTRTNILDAKKGHEIRIEFAPYFNTRAKTKPFLKNQISAVSYFSIPMKLHPVLALRGAIGSIFNIDNDKLPYTERFYVGGSNSLRGYDYQLAGELDQNKKPIGGRSFLETTVELRLKLTDTIGVVGFLDSGFAYKKTTPDCHHDLLHGAGIGFRYITDFGPIRADIAFPLKKRKSVDDKFQLYFGIGQAF